MDLITLPFHRMLPAQLSKGVPDLQAQSNFKMKQLVCKMRFFPSFGGGETISIALVSALDLAELN